MSAPGPEHFYPLPVRRPDKFAFFAKKSPGPIRWPFAVVAVGLVLVGFFAGRASAAELDPRKRPHDLFLLGKPSEASPDSKTIWRIGAGYVDRADCEDAKRRVRVMKPNGTLQCHEAKQ